MTTEGVREAARDPAADVPAIDAATLRALCLECGADDVGLVEIERDAIADQRAEPISLLPSTRTLVSFVLRMNRDNIRAPARSLANLEFHQGSDEVNAIARRMVLRLQNQGIRAVYPASGFPMEMHRFPDKMWVVSHKPIAVAAGLGAIGIHRNVIHPRFGTFIWLGTVLVAARVDDAQRATPLDYNPCIACKLCVAACPVGAIGTDGHFDFTACYTHNYREFMSGFTAWAEQLSASDGPVEYRRRVTDAESASMWQSLSFGPNYKAAYCMAVCPAGEDVIPPYRLSKSKFLADVVKPLQQKPEQVYVVRGSDAEVFVARSKHKRPRVVKNALRPATGKSFFSLLRHAFQRGAAKGLSATYHFRLTKDKKAEDQAPVEATIRIDNQTIDVTVGLHGTADVTVIADEATWLGVVDKERSKVWAVLSRRLRVRGPLRLLQAFERCFPS